MYDSDHFRRISSRIFNLFELFCFHQTGVWTNDGLLLFFVPLRGCDIFPAARGKMLFSVSAAILFQFYSFFALEATFAMIHLFFPTAEASVKVSILIRRPQRQFLNNTSLFGFQSYRNNYQLFRTFRICEYCLIYSKRFFAVINK